MVRRRRILALPPPEPQMALEDYQKEDGVLALTDFVQPAVEKNLKNILEQLEEIQAATKGGAVAGAVSEIKKQLESIKSQVAAHAKDRDVKKDEYKHVNAQTNTIGRCALAQGEEDLAEEEAGHEVLAQALVVSAMLIRGRLFRDVLLLYNCVVVFVCVATEINHCACALYFYFMCLCLCAFLLSLFACLSICGFVCLILCCLRTFGFFASIDYIVFAG